MKLPLFIVIALLLFLGGCAAPNYNYAPKTVEISEPTIGSINTVYIGDPMVRQGTFADHDAILLQKKTKVGAIGTYTFEPGYYTKTGDSRDGTYGFYLPSKYGQQGRVTKGALADAFKIIQAYHDKQKICGVSVFNGMVCSTNTQYKVTTQPATSLDSFQQTLIYSGRINNKVNLSYREFSGSIARPAFNNDVEYDLEQSNTVGYKGARLEIIEATNEYIKYKVLSNFNAARY